MLINLFIIIVMACVPFSLIAADATLSEQVVEPPEMRATDNLIVRTLNGDELCQLERGSMVTVHATTTNYERVHVRTEKGACAGVEAGFVYLNYLRPVSRKVDKTTDVATVSVDGLSLRSEPSVEEGTFKCGLPKKAEVNLLPNQVKKSVLWVEVSLKNPVKGCPEKGWVSSSYLKPDIDVTKLPTVVEKVTTEAQSNSNCTECGSNEVAGGRVNTVERTAEAASNIKDFVEAPEKKDVPGIPNPYVEFLRDLKKNKKCPRTSDYKCNRGLVQMPVDKNVGFCGSHHYSPGRPYGSDSYAAPHTACSLLTLAQEWKKGHCPDDGKGCRFAWGDISHVTRPIFNGHKAHTNGECIDIRPFNKGEFRDAGRTYMSADYDRAKTVEFLKLAKKLGGDIRYSDRKIIKDSKLKDLDVRYGGTSHNNHIHLCFPASNSVVAGACNNLTVDPNVCSELQ